MTAAPKTKSWRTIAVRVGVSLVILAVLLAVLPRERVWSAMRHVPPTLWLLVLAGYMAGHVIGVIKYRMMVNLAGAGLGYLQAAQCYFGGLFGTLFLPSIVGGDLVRASLGLRMARHRTGFLLGSFLDRLLDIAALALVAGAGMLMLPGQLEPRSRKIFVTFLVLAALAGAAAFAAAMFLPVRLVPYKLRRRLVRLRQAARSMRRGPLTVLFSLIGGVTVQSSFVLLTAVLAVACGLEVPLRIWFFAWPLAKISALTPLTQGGLGVREAVLAALMAPFGAPVALTVAVGLVWQTVIISAALVSSLLALAARRLTSRTGQISDDSKFESPANSRQPARATSVSLPREQRS